MSLAALFAKKIAQDLLAKTARKLTKKYEENKQEFGLIDALMPDDLEVEKALGQLVSERKLDDVFKHITEPSELTGAIIDSLISRIKEIQEDTGGFLKPDGVIGKRTIKWLTTESRCGMMENSLLDLPAGSPPKAGANGYPVILFYVETDSQGNHKLPKLNDAPLPGSAFYYLSLAFSSWVGYIKLEVNSTLERGNANLIITTDSLPPGSPMNYLALTSVGPPKNQQLMMTFDVTETWTAATFQACAAHEFGHALGIRHAHVRQPDQLMNGYLNPAIITPRLHDIMKAIEFWGAR